VKIPNILVSGSSYWPPGRSDVSLLNADLGSFHLHMQ
jgi:hypothetical protein